MPRRDETEFMDVPGLRADRGEVTATRPAASPGRGAGSPSAPAPAQDGFMARYLAIAALCLAFGVGVGAFLLYQQQVQTQQALADATARIVELEKKLSTSDESWNESSVVMQVKLKDLAARSETLRSDLDKLARRNQKEIEDQAELMKKQDGALRDDLKTLASENQMAHTALTQKSSQIEQTLASRQKSIDDTVDRMNKMASEHAGLVKRMQTTEDWIDSINTYRKQVNQSLESLRKQIEGMGQPAQPRPAGQLQ